MSAPPDDLPAAGESPVLSSVDRLRPGHCGRVHEVRATGEDGDRLKAMGICAGRRIMLVRTGDPLILRVLGSRVGLSARLAAEIRVEACGGDFSGEDR